MLTNQIPRAIAESRNASDDGPRGHVAGAAAGLPIRGPKNTISANEASGKSQASANNSGNKVAKVPSATFSSSAWSTSIVT